MAVLRSLLDEALEAWAYTRAGVIDELRAFPDKALGFRPADEARTAAELVRHIIESNLMMSGELSRANGDFQRKSFEGFLQEYGRGVAAHRTKKQLLEALRRTHREGEAKIRHAGELHMLQLIRRFDGEMGTRLAWMHHGIAHEEYHRGQLATLRAADGPRAGVDETDHGWMRRRRSMTRRTLGLAVALSVGLAAVAAAQAHTKETQATMTPAKSLDALKEGNARFLAGKQKPRNLKAEVAATAAGQYPFAAVVSCMDSRAPVEIILDQGIGDLFSLRVAGNVIEGDFLGSLEYAAKVVGVKLIVVMGHTSCGAVKGAIDDVKLGNLTALLAQIEPAIVAVGPPRGTSKDHAYVEKVAEANVRNSMKQIHDQEPGARGDAEVRPTRPRGRDVRRRDGEDHLLRRLTESARADP